MLVLVSYDVAMNDERGPKRLRRVAKTCQNYGQRVQYSVFECIVDPAQWTALREQLIKEINQEEDRACVSILGSNWRRRVEHVGAKKTIDQEGPLIV